MTHRGFTLIELLAVLVILGMATAIALPKLASIGELTARRAAIAEWRELDAKARLVACRSAGAAITIDASTAHLIANERAVATAAVPAALAVEAVKGERLQSIEFDAAGRAPDYLIIWRSDAGASRRWRISGLTGWWEEVEP